MALADNLVAYYSLSNANDSVGASNLTNNNTVTFVAGKVGNAGSFVRASSQSLSIADNAALSMADIDFTIAGWVNLTTKPSFMGIISKWGTDGNREYYVGYDSTPNRFQFGVSSTGFQAAAVTVNANTLGIPALATWYFLAARHDSVGNVINISVNAGAVDSVSHSAGVANMAGAFNLGALGGSNFYNGLLDEVGIWKRYLSDAEITDLYNGGSGRDYTYVSTAGAADSNAQTIQLGGRHGVAQMRTGGARVLMI